jgi:hypothetical protein
MIFCNSYFHGSAKQAFPLARSPSAIFAPPTSPARSGSIQSLIFVGSLPWLGIDIDAFPKLLRVRLHHGRKDGKQFLTRRMKGMVDSQILQHRFRKGEKKRDDLLLSWGNTSGMLPGSKYAKW